MKKDIHPKYYPDAEIICSCGVKYKVGSTVKKMHVEICSHCHPFFTGALQKIIDTSGRVERFKERAEKTANLRAKKFKKVIDNKKKVVVNKKKIAVKEKTDKKKAITKKKAD